MDQLEIAVRAYVTHKVTKSWQPENQKPSQIVAVIDTETSADQFLNLKFSSFMVWIHGKLERFILFYSESISREELAILRIHALHQNVEGVRAQLLPIRRFIDEVFYPIVYDAKALLIGFNLPFDISRLAYRYGISRKWKTGFTFSLSKNCFRSQIRIKSLNSTAAFIEFTRPAKRNQRHPRANFKGHFLDLHSFVFALTNKNLSLEHACELFQTTPQKTSTEEHGKITSEYINYNITDTRVTYSLFLKTIERYKSFHVTLPPERIYSPASFGKQCLKQMGIKPFLEQNPNFPPEYLGYVMTTYYGGRSEIRVRKKPVKVRYMDFTSMYPSLFSFMDLWPLVTAERIEAVEATREVRRIIEKANLDTLRDPTFWKSSVAIVEVIPEEDILPARCHYGDKYAYNIGISYLSSSRSLWYTLPDILASKLLTGKSPKILSAIEFVPKGKQPNLSEITIVGDSKINPDKDLLLKLRQLRIRAKTARDQEPEGSDKYIQSNIIQEQLKIVGNATSYGIFIEVNTEGQRCEAEVHGLEGPFKCEASKRESFGSYFNPIISTTLTSSARLLLAMAEAWLQQHGAYYTFCDTDSMGVQPFYWQKLQKYFEPLNPMPEESDFLKVEDENYDEQGKLRDLWFYGTSAKRYALYVLDEHGEPVPVKWSSHGLGHLMHDKSNDWEKELWTNILRFAYGKITKQQLLGTYRNEYAVAKLQITTSNLLRRVKAINKGKPYNQQIKPFNFVLVGSPTMPGRKGPIIPLTHFTRPELAPLQTFTDARTGKLYNDATEVYWKRLDRAIVEYVDHPESKFENGDRSGTMRRRHLNVNSICYIGKEANELEETEVLGLDEDTYVEYLPPVSDNNKGVYHCYLSLATYI